MIAAVVKHQLERPAAYGGERQTHSGSSTLSILPGLPGITIHGDPLYGPDDPWKSYLADERTCPGGEDLGRALAEQAETMVCLVNFARRQRGLGPVATTDILNGTSLLKAERIERCRDFNHDACGEDAAFERGRPDISTPGARTSSSPRAPGVRRAPPSTGGSTRTATGRTCSARMAHTGDRGDEDRQVRRRA